MGYVGDIPESVPSALKPKSQWISVDDRLPINSLEEMNGKKHISIPVIVATDGMVDYCEFHCGNAISFWTEFGCDNKVTHWMPLPPLPEGE